MKKNVGLKWQLFIGITLTYILIIGAALYFFNGIDKQIEKFKGVGSKIQGQINSVHEFDSVVNGLNQSADVLKTRTYILIAFLMLVLLYILNRIVKTIRELRQRSKETHLLNKEIQAAQKKIEDSNWVLSESSKLNERISGVDDDNKIAQIAFNTILEAIEPHAAAIYIRKVHSYEYELKQHIGVDSTSKLPESFLEGEGLLGRVAKKRKLQVIHENVEKYSAPPVH
ncbi:hypothetical protein [Sphingobacterium sp. SGR-19]|uniref:hypothetical protein n=1 Tax=Sphingobacterium sp. SGR-19 TaxID=2710886 RepID=UPI0013EAE9EC|nr:hypothetical protein [Sphingobacterium sp. SGR-19]NGM64736.1 hypothetical protein [Sphingobacterium sp. SGR-19]